jgi:hypothetical protein
MKNLLLLTLSILSLTFTFNVQAQSSIKIVDTINYLGFKKTYGSPKGRGVKMTPTIVKQDSIKIPMGYQKFKNTATFVINEIAIPMVSLNTKGATVSVKINNKEVVLGESILNVAYHPADLTTYWFKFKTPIEITGDYQIYIQPNTYADSIYLPTSGEFINSNIKANITGNKLTIVNSNGNIGNSFWIGQQITGNGIVNDTKIVSFNPNNNEYTLSSSLNSPLTNVIVTGINKTFGSHDGGFLLFEYALDKNFLPKFVPDMKTNPSFLYESLSWDPIKKESIYEEDFVMYPVVEYTWKSTPVATAVCLGDSKTIQIDADKSSYDNFVKNPFFNSSAFLQEFVGLGKSSGNFYGRIANKSNALKDTLDVNSSKMQYSFTYLNDNANDSVTVFETIKTYGYTTSKAITLANKLLVSSKIIANANVSNAILCNGGTGSVLVSGIGGFAPLTGIGTMNNVKAGSQSFFVTDANGCKSQANVNVVEPSAISISGTPTTETTCSAGDAKIDIVVTGANAPYSYSWTNNAKTQNIASLSAGLYTVTVTDKNACTKTKDFIISAIGAPVASATLTEAIKCFGGNAKVTVAVTSGGQSPFTGTGVQINQKSGGQFYTVIDKNNCKGVAKLTITEPAQLIAKAVISDSIKCNGGDAKVVVSATGGTLNYSGIGEMSGVKAGSKSFLVTDANSCTSNALIVVNEPALLVASSLIKSAINCHYGVGIVTVNAQGGTLPYVGNGDKLNVHAGSKSYLVTDAKGCTSTTNLTMTEPVLLEIERTSIAATNDTVKDGKAIIIPTGGVAPYTYAWKDNETLKLLNVNNDTVLVKAGSYSITVFDKNGCSAKTSVTVDANQLVSLSKMNIALLKMYPNPVADKLSIQLETEQETTLKLISLTGQVMHASKLEGNSTVSIDMSELSSGFYLLHLENRNGTYIQKIEKL